MVTASWLCDLSAQGFPVVSRLRKERLAVLPRACAWSRLCRRPRAALPMALQSPRHLSARETKAGELEGSPRKAKFAALKEDDWWGTEYHKCKTISRMDTVLTHHTVIFTFPLQ